MKSTTHNEAEIYRKEEYEALQERIKEIEEIVRPDDEQLILFLKRLKGKKQPYSLFDEKFEIEQDILKLYLPEILYCVYSNDYNNKYYWKYLKKIGATNAIEFINTVRDKIVDFIKRCRRYYKE